jgi:hypothetical protein
MPGLVSVATYQNYSNLGDIVDKQASNMSAIYRDFSAYPQPIRRLLEDALQRVCPLHHRGRLGATAQSYRPEVGIGPESIARVYETVMKPDESVADNVSSKAEEAGKAPRPKGP